VWIEMPSKMPLYGSKELRELTITIYFRKSFLEESAYNQVAMAVAHELSHVVLDSIQHPYSANLDSDRPSVHPDCPSK
jgi:hypothetical protein